MSVLHNKPQLIPLTAKQDLCCLKDLTLSELQIQMMDELNKLCEEYKLWTRAQS